MSRRRAPACSPEERGDGVVEFVAGAVRYLWAFPATCVGYAVGMVGLLSGGTCRRRGWIVEFHGGGVAWLLQHVPGLDAGAAAMTLGHCILAQSPADLDGCYDHERVHVRQYERWGPFFIPAYLACSFWLWLRGRDHYLDNPFEREAFAKSEGGSDEGTA